jgi:ABC-type lipoprotein release transport system permease subunit
MASSDLQTGLRQAGMLFRIASRNLLASRAKSVIVGGIILFGAALVVVGSSLVDGVDTGMRRSIQGSLGGHIQVYDDRSKDDLALYGGATGEPDLEPIEDFSRLARTLGLVPNVKAVVPMGIDMATIAMGNPFDVALERLRADVRRCAGEAGAGSCSDSAGSATVHGAHLANVRRMVGLLADELSQARRIADERAADTAEQERSLADLERARSEVFWAEFGRDPLGSLEFLENRIAPLSVGGGSLPLRYVATDLDAFAQAFDGFQVVEGTPVPRGARGILLGKLYVEQALKLRTARRLDQIKEARDQRHARIATDERLQAMVKENQTSTREILAQLDPENAREAVKRLGRVLGTDELDLALLLVRLFATDDENFEERYRVFYSELAPLLQVYRVLVGDTISLEAPAASGYTRSVNVKVYGLVQFKGLERSDLAGSISLMDLMTFRALYGYPTPGQAAEVGEIKAGAGARAVARESAEAELFGSGAGDLVESGRSVAIGDYMPRGGSRRRGEGALREVYSQQEMDGGLVKNAAVILADARRIPETIRAIEEACRRDGLPIRAVSWHEASGTVGQFVTLARLILYGSVFILFAVALVVINNATVMATLSRVKEIGTMRAMGAQRRFVLLMVLLETMAVGLLFGVAGAALGSGIVWLVGAAGGIPATNGDLYFFYSGPSLVPRLGAASLGGALAIVIGVSALSALYPALLATRVAPVVAMQSDD